MRDPYRELAPLYDVMAADPGIQAFYAEFQASIREATKAHHIRPRVIVDLACGTGNTTVPWVAGLGRTVIGVDQSAAMLRVARRKSARVRWVRQNIERLRLDVRADVVTCHFDALNHVLEADGLQRVFVKQGRLYRKVEVSVRERAFDEAEIRGMLRSAGLRLERVSVQRRMKGRPIRKVYLVVKPLP